MNNQITLSFTAGQLFAIIGAICLVALTVYLVGVLKELKKTLRQVNETVSNVNEIIEDVQTTKLVVTNKIAEFAKYLDIAKRATAMKEKFTRKKNKK